MHPFDYEKPTSLEEAGALLTQAEGNGCVLAGGTNLLFNLETESIQPEVLVDIKGLPKLREISFNTDSGLSLGAAATLSSLAVTKRCPPSLSFIGRCERSCWFCSNSQ